MKHTPTGTQKATRDRYIMELLMPQNNPLKVILVPYWIFNALTRAGKPIDTVSNREELLKTVPPSEVDLLDKLQYHWSLFLGKRVNSNYTVSFYTGLAPILEPAPGEDHPDADFREALLPRLFNPMLDSDGADLATQARLGVTPKQNKLAVLNGVRNTAYVVVYNGYFGYPNTNLESALTLARNVLESGSIYTSQEELARLPIFKRYLELLQDASPTVG